MVCRLELRQKFRSHRTLDVRLMHTDIHCLDQQNRLNCRVAVRDSYNCRALHCLGHIFNKTTKHENRNKITKLIEKHDYTFSSVSDLVSDDIIWLVYVSFHRKQTETKTNRNVYIKPCTHILPGPINILPIICIC